MKTRQLELRAIPQFDSGRWKLRLERVPVDPRATFQVAPFGDSRRLNLKQNVADAFSGLHVDYRDNALMFDDVHEGSILSQAQKCMSKTVARCNSPGLKLEQ